MLTIFAIPRAFEGHKGIIQRNAITSWTALHPRPEILLFGDDPGTAEICRELNLIHVPELARTLYGAPLLADLFEKAQRLAHHNLLSYVNADIILLGDFLDALRTVAARKEKFLMVGRRWDVSLERLWDFGGPAWENELRVYVLQNGTQAPPPGNSDYFAFPRSLWSSLPPFGIGRAGSEAWLIYEARRLGVAVADVSYTVMAIHQKHDQSSYPHGLRRWRQEVNQNYELVGKDAASFCLFDATHLVNGSRIRRPRGIHYLSRYADTLPLFHPRLAAPLWIPRAAIAGVRGLRKRIGLARDPVARLAKLVLSKLPADGITAVLGFTDAPSTQPPGNSRGLRLADGLLWSGYPVVAYDPEPSVLAHARRLLGGPIEFAMSVEECVREADVVVIASSREEFQPVLAELLVYRKHPCVVIDCCAHQMQGSTHPGIEYLSLAEK
jgi:hypothetical protein